MPSPLPRARCRRVPLTFGRSTPGGTRTRTSELRVRRHRPSTTGAKQGSGGRTRTCASRSTIARRCRCRRSRPQSLHHHLTASTSDAAALDYTGANGGSRIRTCERAPPVYALAPRRLQPLPWQRSRRQSRHDLRAASQAMPWPPKRKGRESNPQGREAHPFSRRGTAPMAALPSERPRQESNLHHTD
jgi:hypothetical protein